MLSNLVGEDWVSKETCFFHDLCAASINLSLPGPSLTLAGISLVRSCHSDLGWCCGIVWGISYVAFNKASAVATCCGSGERRVCG